MTRRRPACVRCGADIHDDDALGAALCDDCFLRGGTAVGWVATAALIILVAIAIALLGWALAAPRAAADPTTEAPRDVSGLRDGTSGRPLPGASRPQADPGRPAGGELTLAAGAPRMPAAASGAASEGAQALTTPMPAPTGEIGTAIEVGRASWYRDPRRSGFYAAAPWWRFGMDPEPVSVCRIDDGQATCVALFVTDHCQCYVGTDRARVIDLSPAAFAELAPLSRGLVIVQVERGSMPDRSSITLPPTSTEE